MQTFIRLFSFFFCFITPSIFASNLMLCGGAQVTENDVVAVNGHSELHEVWRWRPEQSKGLPVKMMRKFITTDDCKTVSQGREVLITSSGDAVALVSHRTGDTLFYAAVKNAHSAELLPGGLVAVASSSDPNGQGDRLLLFDRAISEKSIFSMPLSAAHGTVWDSKRQVLWVLGGSVLSRLTLQHNGTNASLSIEKSIPLPAPEGHDLQLADDGSALYVTNTTSVFTVDPDTLTFAPFAPFHGWSEIKSLSINPSTKQIAFTQADPGVWWTYTLRFLNPNDTIHLPTMIYKVRWVK